MTKLTFHAIYSNFGLFHSPAQQASWATLLDDDGNVVSGVAPLDCDGEHHERDIYRAVDDYWMEQAALVAEEQEHAA